MKQLMKNLLGILIMFLALTSCTKQELVQQTSTIKYVFPQSNIDPTLLAKKWRYLKYSLGPGVFDINKDTSMYVTFDLSGNFTYLQGGSTIKTNTYTVSNDTIKYKPCPYTPGFPCNKGGLYDVDTEVILRLTIDSLITGVYPTPTSYVKVYYTSKY